MVHHYNTIPLFISQYFFCIFFKYFYISKYIQNCYDENVENIQ
nr:MAG TPA: hypothetical protein [Caudoviricetes sp.]